MAKLLKTLAAEHNCQDPEDYMILIDVEFNEGNEDKAMEMFNEMKLEDKRFFMLGHLNADLCDTIEESKRQRKLLDACIEELLIKAK